MMKCESNIKQLFGQKSDGLGYFGVRFDPVFAVVRQEGVGPEGSSQPKNDLQENRRRKFRKMNTSTLKGAMLFGVFFVKPSKKHSLGGS